MNSENESQTKEKPEKLARAIIKVGGTIIRESKRSKGSVVADIPLADAEFKESKGLLDIINVYES